MRPQGFSVLTVEVWHGILLLTLLVMLAPLRIVEPWALLLGGLFMGVNFFLLGYGMQWVLAPFARKGRVQAGIFLLVLKLVLFLGLLWALFRQVRLDGPSFAVGVTSLLVAVFLERLWSWRVSS